MDKKVTQLALRKTIVANDIAEIYYNDSDLKNASELMKAAIRDYTHCELSSQGISNNFIVSTKELSDTQYTHVLIISKLNRNYSIKPLNKLEV